MIVQIKHEGDPTGMHSLYCTAWYECKELQARDMMAGLIAVTDEVEQFPRAEMYSDDGFAGIILVPSEDMHVGPCAVVMWAYVHPDHRQKNHYPRLLRQAIRQAREWRLPYIAYTHRVGEGEYATRYRRI